MRKKITNELMSEAEPIIEKIAKANKNNTFAYFEQDDIEQEVWALCLDALQRYDTQKGHLENFLRNHVYRRLKNLKRDRYYRPGIDAVSSGLAWTRMNIVNALPLYCVDIDCDFTALTMSIISSDPLDGMMAHDTYNYLLDNLPDELVEPFNNLVNGNIIKKKDKDAVQEVVIDLLIDKEEYDD